MTAPRERKGYTGYGGAGPCGACGYTGYGVKATACGWCDESPDAHRPPERPAAVDPRGCGAGRHTYTAGPGRHTCTTCGATT